MGRDGRAWKTHRLFDHPSYVKKAASASAVPYAKLPLAFGFSPLLRPFPAFDGFLFGAAQGQFMILCVPGDRTACTDG